ncbi:unnamed protein product [Schistosoma turkestanicum]|nr:unnamed protein product [Schistosoma turkestanicum]
MNRPEAVLLARLRTQGWTLPKHVYDSIPCSSMSLNSSGINCFIGDFEDSNDANESNKEEEYNYCDNPECMVNSDEYLVNETEDCKENSDFQSTPLIKDDAETNISVSFSLNEVCKHGKYKRRGLGCSMKHLAPPKPSRLFLLSPPSSPPVGWEPKPECEPVINYELLQALASLAPGEAFELHPCDQVKHHPSIVVTPCETGPMYDKDMKKLRIIQTKCPDRKC